MAKTKEELNTLKNEYEAVANKLKELNDDELGYVAGGSTLDHRETDGSVSNPRKAKVY